MPGIFTLAGMGLQFPPGGIVVSLGDDGAPVMSVAKLLVRLDLWLTWLEIGCIHAEQARLAGACLAPDLSDADKYEILTQELHAGLVALTAFSFAMDAFYDLVQHEYGSHPDRSAWRRSRTAREAQVTETLRYHLKLGPTFSSQLRDVLKQLFEFRGRAVHPSSAYVEPNFRPQIDSGVHPHLVTFSGPHVVQCRALVLQLLSAFVDRGHELAKAGTDIGWLTRGKEELQRLSLLYRIDGDDKVAYETAERSET